MFDLNNIYDKANLTALIRQDIDAFSMTFDDGHRTHLGASLIGSQCERYLWYVFRWAFRANVEPRMYRLWQRGHREEEWLWAMLRACGWTVLDRDPATGKQWRVSACAGHFGGSLDAIGFPPPHYPVQEWLLLECKTNKSGENGRKWEQLEQHGMTVDKPQHWAQSCVYGYLKGIRWAVYFNTNKDDDRQHIEPLVLDTAEAQRNLAKAEFVILAQAAPQKLHQNRSHHDCKYCDAREVCHNAAPLQVNCRSCRHARPIQDKQWFCQGYNAVIPEATIETGCTYWQGLIQ